MAGVEYYLPLYREVSSHPRVLDRVVAGSPEPMTSAQLHSEACRAAREGRNDVEFPDEV
jgi:hypothetical protein